MCKSHTATVTANSNYKKIKNSLGNLAKKSLRLKFFFALCNPLDNFFRVFPMLVYNVNWLATPYFRQFLEVAQQVANHVNLAEVALRTPTSCLLARQFFFNT